MAKLHDILGISEKRLAKLVEGFNKTASNAKREADVIVAIEREKDFTIREKLFLAEILGKTVEANRKKKINKILIVGLNPL